ncbi:MAG TPA: RHS repeat-associated core domain-containing protein [Actinomycetota bacterium]
MRRRPWLFRTLRFAPLALAVALAFLANVLQAVPPSERSRVLLDGSTTRLVSHNDPTPSGADPLYPLNHTVDGKTESVGTPPANSGFEQAGGLVGTPPVNHDLQTAPVDSVTVPNGDFETGTFANWTLTGSPTISSDQTRGYWASLGSGHVITSSAIAVPSSAQALTYQVGYLTTNNYSWVKVYVVSGADFATSTLVKDDYCFRCGYWSTNTLDLGAYRGQTIKLKFSQYSGTIGINDVKVQQVFPGFDVSGTYFRALDGTDAYAWIQSGGWLTTAQPFAVHPDAQSGTVEMKGNIASSQYQIQIATGPNFSTYTTVASGIAPASWQGVRFYLGTTYAGQQIKLRVRSAYNWIAVDDLGIQQQDLPGWSTSGDTRRIDDGSGNHYATTNGTITSSAFQIPANAENLSFRIRSEGDVTQTTVNLLRGTDFSTVTQIHYDAATPTWKTVISGVAPFAGETVKLRFVKGIGGRLAVDDAGLMESVLPGWTPNSADALATGENANGTFATPAGDDSAMFLRSSWISTAIVDRTGFAEMRQYAISYEFGSGGGLLQLFWVDAGGSLNVFQDAANGATAYRTRYFWLADFMAQRGHFVVKLTGSGSKFYSIADNVARQQLSEPFSRKVGLGIDTTTGSVAFAENGITIPGPIPLSFTRYYNAHADRRGPLGYRWSHTYETHLEILADGDAGAVYGSGREEFFNLNTFNGTFAPADSRVHSTLVKNADGTYALTTKANLIYRFTSTGVLSAIEDLNGNTVSLAYDPEGRLWTVTGAGGTSLTFSYDAQSRLSTVTDPANATYTFGYDANNDLVSVTDPLNGVRSYVYNHHRLTRVTDENGDLVVDNTYDDYHRVISQTDAANKTISLAYDTPGMGATTVTFPDQGIGKFYFDRFGRTTDTIDPTDRRTRFLYDSNGNLDKIVDSGNAAWDMAFDASADLTSATDPLGNPISLAYNAKHLPTSITDARGNTTTMTYDADGNMTSLTNPLNKTWTYTYDVAGYLLTETDPLDKTTTYTYDSAGNRLTKTDPLNHTWTYTYDAANRLKTETDPLGNTTTYFYDLLGRIVSVRDPLNREATFLYDLAGHLLRATDPLGNQTNWAYDDRGLVSTKTDPADKVWSYTYDENRNMTSVTDPLNKTTTYGFDDANRLTSIRDPLGSNTTYSYDAAGRLASTTDPLNRVTSYTYDAAGHLSQTTLPNIATLGYAYDANGNLTSVTDELGNANTSAYDAANRLTSTTDPLNKTTSYGYDAADRRTSVTDPLNRTTVFAYDAAGRLVSTTDPLNKTTTYGYDIADRRISVTDPTNRTTTVGYDAAGQLLAVTDPGGRTTTSAYDAAGRLASVTEPSGAVTSYGYNSRGLLTSVTDPLFKVTTYGYDDAGRMSSETDPLNNATTYRYDGAGRLATITDALGGVVTLGYDAASQLTSVTDTRSKTWSYGYNALGIRNSVTDPLNRQTTWGYNAAGQLTSRTDARGIQTSYGYDAARRQTSVAYPGGSVGYTYNDAGERTQMADPTGQTTSTYDAAGRITAVSSPRGQITYTYDSAGRRASMTLPGNRTLTYDYNARGLLSSLTDWQGSVTSFDYDSDGNRTKITRPNGVESDYAYDSAGHVTSITHTKGATTLLSFAYTYDDAGRRTSVTTPEGTESYSYDSLGRLTQVSYPGGPTVSYTYDGAGNRKTETRGGNPTNYDYDAAGQLLTVGNKIYTYDANGNLTQAGSDSFTWDYDNRLTQATIGTHTASYAYDGDGVRSRATVDGNQSNFLVDTLDGLPTLVDDGSKAYLHADGALSEISAGGATQVLADGLGSVRGLADTNGSLVASQSYEAFGTPRTTSGTSSLFGFTGEPTDATGLVYLRARSFDPSMGRLLSADTVQPNANGTQGYNLYAYVANNPATWVDPSGHSFDVDQVDDLLYYYATHPEALAASIAAIEAYANSGAIQAGGAGAAIIITVIAFILTAAVLMCFTLGPCDIRSTQTAIDRQGSAWPGDRVWTAADLLEAAKEWPAPATVADPTPDPVPGPEPRRRPRAGESVYRVWGGQRGPFGASWTPDDPQQFGPEKFRDLAGLPDRVNHGNFITVAILKDPRVVPPSGSHPSLPMPEGPDAWCDYQGIEVWEYEIPNAAAAIASGKIVIVNVLGPLNPPYGGRPPNGCP